MNLIVTKQIADTRYMLGAAETASGHYKQIKATFPGGDEYKIFAEPIILDGGFKISWMTDYPGTPICYNSLSDEEKALARDLLSEKIKKLLSAVKKFNDNNIVDFMYKCIEIPGMSDVYLVRKNGEDNVVITQWGFVNDTPGAEKGLLYKILNVKKIPMNFSVVYSDSEQPAPFEDIIFEFDGNTISAKSDENGKIVLEKVKENSFVKAFEPDGEQRINMQTFTCYEDGKYKIKVTPKPDMLFIVTNQKQQPLSGFEFIFEYNGSQVNAISNAEGKITLNRIKSGTTVRAYQIVNQQQDNVNTFVCNPQTPFYPIVVNIEEVVVKEPETHNMRFKVTDEKNNIVANAEVTVKYNGKTEVLHTDENGYAVLLNVPPGTQVEVKAKK